LTSVSFERPPALSKDSPVPLPALIDDEYLSEIVEGQQPQSIPSRLGFFVYMIKLINIREKLPTDKVRNAPIWPEEISRTGYRYYHSTINRTGPIRRNVAFPSPSRSCK
jgi:hypothetical protein